MLEVMEGQYILFPPFQLDLLCQFFFSKLCTFYIKRKNINVVRCIFILLSEVFESFYCEAFVEFQLHGILKHHVSYTMIHIPSN